MESAKRAHGAIVQLEQRLRGAQREKGFYEPSVRAIRAQLKEAYRSLLFSNYAYAQEVDTEQSLWKHAFYKPIEEFRQRIRQPPQAGEKGRQLQAKATAAFLKFLSDSRRFYRRLAASLEQQMGPVGLRLPPLPQGEEEEPAADEAADQAADEDGGEGGRGPRASAGDAHAANGGGGGGCRVSVYRCLICLGDLARYEAPLLSDRPKKDWGPAASYYREAARIFPEGGNSFNQLAVLETHEENELGAVYHYFRALSAQLPFLVARENLVLLFEQNRKRFRELPPPPPLPPASNRGGSSAAAGAATGAAAQGRGGGQRGGVGRPLPSLLSELVVRWVRCHGLLFTRTDAHTLLAPPMWPAARADLAELARRLVAPPPTGGGNGGGNGGGRGAVRRRAAAVLGALAPMAAFSAHNVYWAPEGHQPNYSEVLQRTELRRHAMCIAFGAAAVLADAVADALGQAPSQQGQQAQQGQHQDQPLASLAAPLSVLLQWLTVQQRFLSLSDPNEEELHARADCWQAAARLVPLLRRLLREAPGGGSIGLAGGAAAAAAGADQQVLLLLPEEVALRGFQPLQPALEGRMNTGEQLGEQAEAMLRWRRLLDSVGALSAMLAADIGSSAAGTAAQAAKSAAAKHRAAFDRMAGAARTLADAVAAAEGQPAGEASDGGSGGGAAAMSTDGAGSVQLPPQQQQQQQDGGTAEEEEEEEVIVYSVGCSQRTATPPVALASAAAVAAPPLAPPASAELPAERTALTAQGSFDVATQAASVKAAGTTMSSGALHQGQQAADAAHQGQQAAEAAHQEQQAAEAVHQGQQAAEVAPAAPSMRDVDMSTAEPPAAPGTAGLGAARPPSPSHLPSASLFSNSLFGRDLFADSRPTAHVPHAALPAHEAAAAAFPAAPMHQAAAAFPAATASGSAIAPAAPHLPFLPPATTASLGAGFGGGGWAGTEYGLGQAALAGGAGLGGYGGGGASQGHLPAVPSSRAAAVAAQYGGGALGGGGAGLLDLGGFYSQQQPSQPYSQPYSQLYSQQQQQQQQLGFGAGYGGGALGSAGGLGLAQPSLGPGAGGPPASMFSTLFPEQPAAGAGYSYGGGSVGLGDCTSFSYGAGGAGVGGSGGGNMAGSMAGYAAHNSNSSAHYMGYQQQQHYQEQPGAAAQSASHAGMMPAATTAGGGLYARGDGGAYSTYLGAVPAAAVPAADAAGFEYRPASGGGWAGMTPQYGGMQQQQQQQPGGQPPPAAAPGQQQPAPYAAPANAGRGPVDNGQAALLLPQQGGYGNTTTASNNADGDGYGLLSFLVDQNKQQEQQQQPRAAVRTNNPFVGR